MTKLKVCHVITNTDVGGAETMLLKLLAESAKRDVLSSVVSLMRCGDIGDRVQAMGVPLVAMGMKRRPTGWRPLWSLVSQLRQFRPDVVQTWMYHADLFGGLAGRWMGVPVLWNVRHGPLDRRSDSPTTQFVARLCGRLSSNVPRTILYNSHTAATAHQALGYSVARQRVIPNGFDTNRFCPSHEQRDSFRARLGISQDTILIGHSARFHPVKDHATFLRAASIVASEVPNVRFVMSGNGVTEANGMLADPIRNLGLAGKCHLLGPLLDMRSMLNGIDHFVLSSLTEGFPNVIGEAMACGRSCVVTDAGDCRRIIGKTGWVVPARSPRQLANAIRSACELSAHERRQRSTAARRRVEQNYALSSVAEQYVQAWLDASQEGSIDPPRRRATTSIRASRRPRVTC